MGLVLNIANNGFITGGEKVFSFLKPGFFFAGFRVVTVCPGGLGKIFSFPQTGAFCYFLHLQFIGAGSLTSNALASSGALAYLKGKRRHSDKQTVYSRFRLVKGVLCALKDVLLPVAYIDGVEEIVNLTNFRRCSYLFGSKGPLFGPDAINPFKSSLLLR